MRLRALPAAVRSGKEASWSFDGTPSPDVGAKNCTERCPSCPIHRVRNHRLDNVLRAITAERLPILRNVDANHQKKRIITWKESRITHITYGMRNVADGVIPLERTLCCG